MNDEEKQKAVNDGIGSLANYYTDGKHFRRGDSLSHRQRQGYRLVGLAYSAKGARAKWKRIEPVLKSLTEKSGTQP